MGAAVAWKRKAEAAGIKLGRVPGKAETLRSKIQERHGAAVLASATARLELSEADTLAAQLAALADGVTDDLPDMLRVLRAAEQVEPAATEATEAAEQPEPVGGES
ncbi:hypothetical protein [Engelhardtia mirabilis]